MSILIDLSATQQQARQIHFAVAAMIDAYLSKWYQMMLKKTETPEMKMRLEFQNGIDDKVLTDAMQWYYDYIFQKHIVKYQVADVELLARLYRLFLLPFDGYIKRHGSQDQLQQYHGIRLIILQELTQYCLDNGLAPLEKHEKVKRKAIEKDMTWLLAEISCFVETNSTVTFKWIDIGFPTLESNRKMFWQSLVSSLFS